MSAAARTTTAALLIGCGALMVVAGVMYAGETFWGWSAYGAYLAWERGFIIAAVLVSVLGLALLEQLLRDAGTVVLPRLAFVTYLVGAVVLIAGEAFVIARRGYVAPLFVVFVVLACLAQATYGLALLQSGLVAAWAGWSTIIWNVGILAVLTLTSGYGMYYPAVHFVAPVIIGIALLSRRRVPAGASPSAR